MDIIVKGAKAHNLKNVDVTIPRNKLVVVTGLSGSGKSSLAFDTIYAEGQRRYVESLSSYARQFLEQMEKPDVESIEGLSPAISIEQRVSSRNPRSTVGTITEIYDYMRVLFARVGRLNCFECGRPITPQTISQMVDQITSMAEGTKIALLAPIVKSRKGSHSKELARLVKEGFVRVRIDNETKELSEKIELDKKKKHDIDLFVDRLIIREGIESRLADSLETALKFGNGIAKVQKTGTSDEEILLSEKHACVYCQTSYPEITPQFFSFNSPRGACPSCDGIGTKLYFDPDLIVPNKNLSLREGAIVPWQQSSSTFIMGLYDALARHYKFDIYTPFSKLPLHVQNIILNGSGDETIRFSFETTTHRKQVYHQPFEGIIPHLERRWRETSSDYVRGTIEKFMNWRPCPTCNGTRLRKEALAVTLGERNISQVSSLSIKDAVNFFNSLELTKKEQKIADRILKEILDRLSFLDDVGLNYLSLDRTSGTLSGGEDQRIRLATQIGSSLTGVLYVLDEPSIGLHQRDNAKLLATLKKLRDLDNTVLVVEHDEETILSADHIIDLGPGAGLLGGQIVAAGPPQQILKDPNSLTGQYLSGQKKIEVPKKRRKPARGELTIKGACEHNLKNLDVSFPFGLFITVTGVSGSGKSTLINDTLYAGLAQRIYRSKQSAGKMDNMLGWEKIDKAINIDQSPIGRTPRSNPATYTGLFTPIRELFSELPESKARGYKLGRFSFNVKGGRCEACEGDGIIRIEMHFLPDVYVECDICRGRRFNRETLEIKYKGASIADILSMTVNQAFKFFRNIPQIKQKLQTLIDVGLGYIELGQSATTLSGGEAQRIKLSRELSKRSTGNTLYILDEPTTGLHFADVHKLLDVLGRLVDNGNTVVVIEHQLDVIKSADYCIDLGPEGGEEGGKIVAIGSPEDIAQNPNSYTGMYLKKVLYS